MLGLLRWHPLQRMPASTVGVDMCWGCRPTCDNCKPAELFSMLCPECGSPTTFTREEYLMFMGLPHRKTSKEKQMIALRSSERPVCASCGIDIRETLKQAIRPQPCVKSGIVCGYPCGQRFASGGVSSSRCSKMVPLGRYSGEPRQ